MTHFQLNWLTSTLSPESIVTIPVSNAHLHRIVNESGERFAYVLELANDKLMVSHSIDDIVNNDIINYHDACVKIAHIIGVNHISTKSN